MDCEAKIKKRLQDIWEEIVIKVYDEDADIGVAPDTGRIGDFLSPLYYAVGAAKAKSIMKKALNGNSAASSRSSKGSKSSSDSKGSSGSKRKTN